MAMKKDGNSNRRNTANTAVTEPYKDEEFEAFLYSLGKVASPHWQKIAAALGVDRDTILRWRKHPLAIEARRHGMRKSIENMIAAGGNDWRMWQQHANMLGITNEYDVEITDAKEQDKITTSLKEIVESLNGKPSAKKGRSKKDS